MKSEMAYYLADMARHGGHVQVTGAGVMTPLCE